MNEIKSMRKSNKKVFDLGNGNKKAQIFGAPVHYKDKSKNEWLDININVKQEQNWETEYCITENTFKAYFNDITDAENLTLASFDVDGNWINYKMVDANPDNFEILDNGIKYMNVYPSVDLEYIVSSRQLKENIIIKDETGILSGYSFTLKKQKDLVCTYYADKSIGILDKNYKKLFTIKAPFMYDANGVISYDVEWEIGKVEYNGVEYELLTLVPNQEWLNSEDRVYPICVDPTATLDYNDVEVQDAYVYEGLPNSNYGDRVYIEVEDDDPHDTDGWIQYETKLTNHTINSVNWNVYEEAGFEVLSSIRIYYKIYSSWNENLITDNNQPSYSSDYVSRTFYGFSWNSIDMTNIFTDWFDGVEDNNGFKMRMSSSGETMRFTSKDSTSTSLIHYLEIDYTSVDVISTTTLSTNVSLPTQYYNEFTSLTFNYDSSNNPNLDKYRIFIYDLDDNLIYDSGQIDVNIAPDTNVVHTLTSTITTVDSYKVQIQSITDDGVTGETSSLSSFYYFSVVDTPVVKYNKITIYGGTSTFDKIRVLSRELTNAEINSLAFTDEYTWDEYTTFYAEFNDNTDAGNIPSGTGAITKWKITRTKTGDPIAVTVAELDDLIQEFYDYRALKDEQYVYRLYGITSSEVIAPAQSEYITSDYYGWFLIDPDTDTVYKFDINLSSGTLNNDTDFTRYQTYTRTDAYSRGERDMISGQLTALFHDFETDDCGELVQTNEDLANFKTFVNSSVDKYLKDRRGRIWKVQTNGVPETQWNDALQEQVISVTFSYYESGDVFE